MTELPPGSYHLRAERNGFVAMNYGSRSGTRGGTTLALTQGQSLTGLEMKLSPHAVITGRVMDTDGEPVTRAMVNALRYRYAQGGRQLMPAGQAQTDDRGEYRIFGLQPGRYYLSAMDGSSRFRMPSEDRSPGPRVDDAYVTTYYPGTTDVENASLVEAASGRELQEMNLKLSRARTVRVRGRVVNETGNGDTRDLMIFLRQRNSFIPGNMTQAMPGPEGQFELRGLMPGSYILAAVIRSGADGYSSQQQVEVGTRDVEDILLSVTKGVEMRGSLRVEGPPVENLAGLRVVLRPAESGPTFHPLPMGTIGADGSFVLENIGSDRYIVSVVGLPPGCYTKSIRLGRDDVLDNPLDLARASGGVLEIVLSDGAAEIDGVVADDDQRSFPGATVVLVPDSEPRRKMQQFYKTATTDQAGRYKLSSIDPGAYRIYAFDDIEAGEWMDPDLMNSVRSKGTDVKVQQGGRQTLELKVIPRG